MNYSEEKTNNKYSIYPQIQKNLEISPYERNSIHYPPILLKNLDASKVIYTLSDFKEKSPADIFNETNITLRTAIFKKLNSLLKGNYVSENNKKYRLNKEAIKELFYYWIERKLEQLEESSNNSLITSSFVNIEFFYNRLHNNKFFEDLFFNMMYNFKSVDIPLSGFFTLFTSDVVYKYITQPSEFFILGYSSSQIRSDASFYQQFLSTFLKHFPFDMLKKKQSQPLDFFTMFESYLRLITDRLYELASFSSKLIERVIVVGKEEREKFDALVKEEWKKKYSEKDINDFIDVLDILKYDSHDLLLKGMFNFTADILNQTLEHPKETINQKIIEFFEEVLRNHKNELLDIYERFAKLFMSSNEDSYSEEKEKSEKMARRYR